MTTTKLVRTLFIVLAITSPLLASCSEPESDPQAAVTFAVAPPATPDDPDLSNPKSAIRAYTDWISYAYRVMNSDVATHTFGPYEEVRVNSYVQYNLIEGRGMEQSLQKYDYRLVKSTETSAVLAGSEFWLYRYFASDESKYLTGPLEASYDVTYTVLKQPDSGTWLVDSVEATRTNEPEPSPEQE